MTNLQFLNNAIKVRDLIKNENNDKALELLNSIIQDMQLSIECNSKGFSTNRKKQEKAAYSFLKHIKNMPVLHYCYFKNGVQYFTDGYIAFAINKECTFSSLPNFDDQKEFASYPFVESLFPQAQDDHKIKKDIKQLLDKLKAKLLFNDEDIDKNAYFSDLGLYSYEELNNSKSITLYNVKKIKTICDILGTCDLDIYYPGSHKLLLFVDSKTGNKAILCGFNFRGTYIKKYCDYVYHENN